MTARGSGTGLSGAANPRHGGVLVAFDRMDRILEIDLDNHMAVVQPGVTLEQLDAELAPLGLVYPVFPGEYSASLGGNVNTNAGGMRAVKYGVTRHHVLGLEVVMADGEVMRTGGKFVKSSTGYDLTQLVARVGGHARLRHRGHDQAAPAASAFGHGARAVRAPRRGDRGGAPDRRLRASGRWCSSTSTC